MIRTLVRAALGALAGLAVAFPVLAQATGEIAGRVTDAATSRPVAGAQVSAEPAGARAITAADGGYRLRDVAPGRQTVTVRALGYARLAVPAEVAAGAATPLNLGLTTAIIPLDAVVVTGTIAPTEVRSIPNQVSVVTAAQIEARGVTRVEEVLRAELPGLFGAEAVPQSGLGTSRVRLFARGSSTLGGGASAPRVYVDGVVLSDPGEMNVIDPRSIERIEFIPGPQASTIYGSGAMNGVLQIFLKKGSFGAERTRVSMELAGGVIQNNYDTHLAPERSARMEVGGSRGPVSYTVGGSYRGEGAWIPGRTEERLGVDLGMRLVLDRATAQLTARQGWMRFDGASQPFEREAILAGRRALVPVALTGSDVASRWEQQTLALSVGYASTPWWRHELVAGHDTRDNGTVRRPQFLTFADSLHSVTQIGAGTTTLRVSTTADVPLRGPVRPVLVAGAEHTSERFTSANGTGIHEDGNLRALSFSRRQVRSTGAFGQAQVGFFETAFVTAGVRVEDHRHFGDDYGLSVQPRIGGTLVRTVGALTAKVRGAYGRAISPPPADARQDGYSTQQGIRYLSILGNRDIGPEVQRGGEAGIDLAWDGRFSLGATHYRQTAEDLITTVLSALTDSTLVSDFGAPFSYFQQQYVNLGRVRNTGWELQGTAELGALVLRGTLSTTRSRVLELNDPEDPRYALAAEVVGPARESGALDARYRSGRLQLGGRITHVGPVRLDRNDALLDDAGQPRVLPPSPRVFNPFERFAAGGYRAEGYRTADLNAGYDLRASAHLFANVFNVGDHYRTDVANTAVARGRRTLLGVRMGF